MLGDATEAARHYAMAADLKHPQARFNLGAMYHFGLGVEVGWKGTRVFFLFCEDYLFGLEGFLGPLKTTLPPRCAPALSTGGHYS
jgi:hypothetical protein